MLGLVISQSLAGRWATHVARLRLVVGMLLNVAGLLLLSTLGAGAGTVALTVYFAVREALTTPSSTPWLRPGTCDGHPNELASPH
ncbi:hypothetical protein [Streptomyces sp. AcE210]|uniref:hypothetical protein n=1 Tax=Streptomyces sp. AcE210 TaxID=2292703 RepID=UPI000E301C3D|nr:hypothetical protein [Streptomyces sp. AcE210]RFC77836.1 hypothetical protein DXZ75_08330 [Streptomyces sp. AcE210]